MARPPLIDWSRVNWQIDDATIAEVLGCAVSTVRRQRPSTPALEPPYRVHLGLVPDAWLAHLHGVPIGVIATARRALGIDPFPPWAVRCVRARSGTVSSGRGFTVEIEVCP